METVSVFMFDLLIFVSNIGFIILYWYQYIKKRKNCKEVIKNEIPN